jgi:hypothetical protein
VMISLRRKRYSMRYIRKGNDQRRQLPAVCVHDLCWEVLSRSVDYAPYSFWYETMMSCLKNGPKRDKFSVLVVP